MQKARGRRRFRRRSMRMGDVYDQDHGQQDRSRQAHGGREGDRREADRREGGQRSGDWLAGGGSVVGPGVSGPPAAVTRAWRVLGRVQGVGFRAFARRRAEALGISGYARNLPDGTVEVLARGYAAALDAFVDELRRGPRYARVVDVVEVPVSQDASAGRGGAFGFGSRFEIR